MSRIYAAALGELGFRRGMHESEREYFLAALALTRNRMERRFLGPRVGACDRGDTPQAYDER